MGEFRKRIKRLAIGMLAAFAVLTAYFSYTLYLYGGRWATNPYNPRIRAQKQQVIAGDILDRSGVVIASTDSDGERTYPIGSTGRKNLSHVLGDPSGLTGGVESMMAGYLLGFNLGLFERVYQMVEGGERTGADIALTVDSALQNYIADRFPSGKDGAVVVLNYKTGEILAMYSTPVFDPKRADDYLDDDNGPLVNRATQGRYTPGSIFKVVTLAAAADRAPGLLNETFDCEGEETIGSFQLRNNEGSYHGEETLREAFIRSCNITFGNVGLELGQSALRSEAQSLGFNDNFLFNDLTVYESIFPSTIGDDGLLAWTAVGQGETQVTPLHMAMIAAAVANGGDMMEPALLKAAYNPRGGTMYTMTPSLYKRSMSKTTAELLDDWMKAVVKSGSGTRAQVKGHTIAGKTGTAQVASSGAGVKPNAWFIGYVAEEEHPYAICVLVEKGESGGGTAAPLAGKVLGKAIGLGLGE